LNWRKGVWKTGSGDFQREAQYERIAKFVHLEADWSEDLKDPEFKVHYQEERQALKLSLKIAKLRAKKGLSQQELAKLMGYQPAGDFTD